MQIKNISWFGHTHHDLQQFPKEVKHDIGFALFLAQIGLKHENVKPLKGFKPKIWEIVSNYDKNTYRAIYAVKIGNKVYVLHLFQKKSKHGIATPKKEIIIIKKRLQFIINNKK